MKRKNKNIKRRSHIRMKYVIIGNGFAGINAIESIRKEDKEGEIILISDEEDYSKPLISYYLGKKVRASSLPYRDKEFYEKMKVNKKIGQKAIELDVPGKTIRLNDGEQLDFDKLVLATGGIPFVPPIEGINTEGVFTFTNYNNAQEIENYLEQNNVEKAVVLGGGLIGLKTTEALMERNISTTVVELAETILSTTFDKRASRIFEEALRTKNCNVITQDTIEKVNSDGGKIQSVLLKSGVKINAQALIVAVGVRPNTELVKDTIIKTDRGILVDEHMQTNVEGIFAAGDCTQAKSGVIAIIPIASRQGKIAGTNMSKDQEDKMRSYEGGIPMNSISLAGIPTISVGLTDPEDVDKYEILQKYDPAKNYYKKIILKDNIIKGAIFVKEIDRAGIFTGLIKDGADVSSFKDKLMQDNFGLISIPKNYRKHKVEGPGIEI